MKKLAGLATIAAIALAGCGSSSHDSHGYYNMTKLAGAVQGVVNTASLGEWTVSVQCVLTTPHEATCNATPKPGSGPLAASAPATTFTEVIAAHGGSYFDANSD